MSFLYDLPQIRAFIAEVGKEILDLQRQPLEIEIKKDGSKVTNGDYHAHNRLSRFLTQNYPYPIISEEQENPTSFPRGTVWVIDPIDGTSHYVKGNKDYAIMLALVHDHSPVLTIIHQPARDLGHFAELGKGSYRYTLGDHPEKLKPIHIDRNTPVKERAFQLSGIKRYPQEYAWFTQQEIRNYDIRGGVGIKIAAIAEGSSHYYLNFEAPLKAWDVFPSILLAEEAGAWVGNARGEKLTFDESGYRLTQGICVAPDREILPFLKETNRTGNHG